MANLATLFTVKELNLKSFFTKNSDLTEVAKGEVVRSDCSNSPTYGIGFEKA